MNLRAVAAMLVIVVAAGSASFLMARTVTTQISGRPGVAQPSPSVPIAASTAAAAADPMLALATACPAIPSGSPPAFLQITAVDSAPPQPDPRTQVPARSITATMAASPLDRTTPYAIVAAVVPAGTTTLPSKGAPIDRAGTVQLWLVFDGTAKRKGIRTFAAGTWSLKADAAADQLTFLITARGVTMYWSGLAAGDRFGFVAASADGCGARGLAPNLVPQQVLT